MGKIRVYELAKELEMESKDVIRRLGKMGAEVKNHMSTVDDKYVQMLRDIVRPKLMNHKGSEQPAKAETTEVKAKAPVVEKKEESKGKEEHSGKLNTPKAPISAAPAEQVKKETVVEVKEKAAKKEEVAEKPATEQPRQAGVFAKKEQPRQAGVFAKKDQPRQAGVFAKSDQPRQAGVFAKNNNNRNKNDRNGNRFNNDKQGGQRFDNNRGQNKDGQGQNRGRFDNRNGQGRPDNRGQRPDNRFQNRDGQRPDNRGQNRDGQRPDNRFQNKDGRPNDRFQNKDGQNRPNNRPQNDNKGFNRDRDRSGFGAVPPPPEAVKPQEKKDSRRFEQKKKNNTYDSRKKDMERNSFESNMYRKNSKQNVKKKAVKEEMPPVLPKTVVIGETVIISELAKAMSKTAAELIKSLMGLGFMATVNQEIDAETATILGEEFGITVEVKVDDKMEILVDEADDESTLVERPPIVTVMGHVDHGKTSLLDAIRNTNVTSREAGGITQHIGAYQVEINERKITFLDTPGHEAFTEMRARGAQVTDIAILVVAADDGVMPQTIEAINHAKAADVPIIVAINKIDKPGANIDKIRQELTEHELVDEEWGGSTIMVPISAKKEEGIENLLEMVLLVADMQELKANPDRNARGTVIESKLDKGRGPVATVLIQKGTLKIGDILVCGTESCKVRAMVDDKGRRVKVAKPSTPVEVLGFSDGPPAGEIFVCVETEKDARYIADHNAQEKRAHEM
ncbi:MAG: translation initiation factor IF-2, partial [Firmicutes bacterium]|nr:translation initiation factor IF-2 [Bacillota bacterium]